MAAITKLWMGGIVGLMVVYALFAVMFEARAKSQAKN